LESVVYRVVKVHKAQAQQVVAIYTVKIYLLILGMLTII